MNKNINLEDEKVRARYFHSMAGDSRSIELLLNTCYNYGIIPTATSKGTRKDNIAYIFLDFEKKHLTTIGTLMDLVSEVPNSEFNIKCDKDGYHAELLCESENSEEMFMRIKEIVEESVLEQHTYNYTIMSSVYNIAKIVREVIEADILFGIDKKLYEQGKCGLSIYKDKQINKINTKKADNIDEVINKLKKEQVLNLPTVLFCTFEDLRTFYFELDETVYSTDIEGDEDGQ